MIRPLISAVFPAPSTSVVLSLSCADSDNRDYSTRGTVTGGYNNCLNGQCVDYCSSSAQVVEWYCSDTGYATQEPVSCPYGCTNGACNPTPQQTCTESDGGKVYGVAGTAQVCMGTSCTPYPDSCNGAYVNEYYCAGSNVALDSSHSCDNGCESGACKPAPVVNYNCTDTDGGFDAYSNPSGATVYANLVQISYTPFTNRPLTAGTYTFKFVKLGYQDYETTRTIIAGQTIVLNANLTSNQTNTTNTTGWISATSTPSGASFYVNTLYKGVTPITLAYYGGTGAVYDLKFAKAGYQDYLTSTTVYSGQISNVNANMLAIGEVSTIGWLYAISTPSGASIYVNNVYKGLTPLNMTYNASTYTLKLTKAGYSDYTTSATVYAGQTTVISRTLTTNQTNTTNTTGWIYVTSTPTSANVYVNNIYKGVTQLNMAYAPGTYTLRLAKLGYIDYTTSVTVYLGQTTNVNAALTANQSNQSTGWTAWYDRDEPSGSGDYEDIVGLRNAGYYVCTTPLAIQCQTVAGIDFTQTGQTVTCTTSYGFSCVNSVTQYCYDYRVRFYC